MGDAQLLRDLAQIGWPALITLGGGSRDDLEVGNLRQPSKDLVLDAVCQIAVRLVFAQVFERQNRDPAGGWCGRKVGLPKQQGPDNKESREGTDAECDGRISLQPFP